MGADTTTEEFYPINNCKGEWINDCPNADCKCARKIVDDINLQRELDEDYSEEAHSTAFSVGFWIALAGIVLLGSFLILFLN